MKQQDNPHKKTIALFFGGPSHEHDVSVITALQIAAAIDRTRFDVIRVYITPDGRWFVGDALKERSNYMFDQESLKQLTQVTLDTNRAGGMERAGRLRPVRKGLFGPACVATFDIALPAFHGNYGEDGCIQGLFEHVGIAYAGMRARESALFMDKLASKYMLRGLGIPVVPFAELRRKGRATILSLEEIEAALGRAEAPVRFPCIIKPRHLGSSIGIAKVHSIEEVAECLPAIFAVDSAAILEPFVENMVEYNVSVMRKAGEIVLSAVERPKASEELLDFKQKYCAGSGKGGTKLGGAKGGGVSEGMLSLTRDINPRMPKAMRCVLEGAARSVFTALSCTGAPRIDGIADSKTGEIWVNEINPFPGSAAYFLWEAAQGGSMLFPELLTALIEEAVREHKASKLPKDPVPKGARLLRRSLSE